MIDPDRQSGEAGSLETERTWQSGPIPSLIGLVGVFLITAVALYGRLIDLERYPGGLLEAEARHGIFAKESTGAGLRWLIDGAADLSVTLVELTALVGSLGQFDASAPRIAAAICGAGSVLVTGLWIRRELGPLWGLAGSAVLAGSFWHILFSRIALGPIAGALAISLLAWFLSEATGRRGQTALPWYALAGLATGLAFLSTPSLRLLPVALLVIAAVAIYRTRGGERRAEPRAWLLASATAWLTIAPFLLTHRGDLSDLTPWTATPGLPGDDSTNLLTLPGAVITSFTALVLPDGDPRGLNLPSEAYLSLLLIPWAAIGLLGLFSASNNPANRDRFLIGGILLIAVWIGISAIDAGHPGQLVTLGPLIAALVVYGFYTAVQWARIRPVRYALIALVIAGIAGESVLSFSRYVDSWAVETETAVIFNRGTVAALEAIDDLNDPGPVFLNMVGKEDLLAYFVTPARRHTFDGSWVLPFPSSAGGYLVLPEESPLAPPLERMLEQLTELNAARDYRHFRIHRLDDRIREQLPLSAPTIQYGGGLALYGSDLRIGSDGSTVVVRVAWRVPANSPGNRFELLLRSADAPSINSQEAVDLPPNPLGSGLYQVVVVELEIPETDSALDLEIRVYDEEGDIFRIPGTDVDGYLFMNRYRFEE